jgi:hypothetical protein
MRKSSEPAKTPRGRKTARRRPLVNRPPGRPTTDDESLSSYRDSIVWLLSVTWEDIGWKLPKAETLEELRQALDPLRGQPSDYLATRFLHPTPVASTPKEIRLLRVDFDEAVEKVREAEAKHNNCTEAATKVELAMNQSATEQLGPYFADLLQRWREKRESDKELEIARATLKAIGQEVADKEAGFAQNELLDFIKSKLYARDPLGIANALAGLPVMAWQSSRTRCSKIECKQWPIFQYRVFLTIEAIWNRRNSHSPLPLEQLFRLEIAKLPRTIIVVNPDTGKKHKEESSLRKRLADHFYHLKNALEEVGRLKIHPGEVPFRIASAFTRNSGKPQTAQDQILIERERIR